VKKLIKPYLLPGILFMLITAFYPAVFAQQIYKHSSFPLIQSEEEQVRGNSGTMNNLLEKAYIMEKKSDFNSAVSVYSLAIDLAKSQKDGLMENYLMRKKGGVFLFSGQMDSAHVYFFAVNQYARKNGIDSSLANVLVNQGYLADLEGDNNDCLLYYDSALVIYEKMKDTIGIASVMNNLALFYEDRGEYTKALEHALKNESLLIGKHDTLRYVAGLITLGNVYEKLKEYDTALAIYEESFKLSNEHKYPAYANTSLINRAVIYYRQGKLTESEIEFQRAIEYAEKVGDKASLALLYNNIGIIYRNQDKYDLALKSYMKALQIAKEINDLARQVSINNNLGILYKNKKNYSEAIKYYNESLGLALKMQKKEDIRKTYGNLASLYEESGDFKAALSYLTLENIYQDSVINEEKVRAIEDMKAKYEREKNLAQIKALKNENKIKELEKKSIRTERNSAFGISATVVFLLVLILLYFRMKSRKNMIIAAQKIKQLEDEKRLLAAQSVIVGQEKEAQTNCPGTSRWNWRIVINCQYPFFNSFKNCYEPKDYRNAR